MGVVLNRPLDKRLGELGGDFALGPLAGVPLFKGGPVQTEQLILAAWQAQPEGFQLHLGHRSGQGRRPACRGRRARCGPFSDTRAGRPAS